MPSLGATTTKPTSRSSPSAAPSRGRCSVTCWMSFSAPVVTIAVDDLLGRAPAERDRDPARADSPRSSWSGRRPGSRGHPERHAARDDRDPAHRVAARDEHPEQRVTAPRGRPTRSRSAALSTILRAGAEHDLLQRLGEIARVHALVASPRRQQRRLVDQVARGPRRPCPASRRRAARGRRRRRAARSGCARSRIAARPAVSGGCTTTRRSKRPGRSSAGSSTSARLVAASTITPSRESNPSISVRIWFSVCSRSSWPPMPPPRPRAPADGVELVDEDDRRAPPPSPA